MIESLMTEAIEVANPATVTDGSGNAAFDWSSPTVQSLIAAVQPAADGGVDSGSMQAVWQVFTTIDAVVEALARIEWNGVLYEPTSAVYHRTGIPQVEHCEFTMARGDVPAFPDLVTVRRPGATRDAEYNPVATTTVVDTTPGLLKAPGPAGEGLVAGQAGLEVDTEVQVPVGTVARAGDIIVVAGRGTWRVVHVLEDRFMIRLRVTRSEP